MLGQSATFMNEPSAVYDVPCWEGQRCSLIERSLILPDVRSIKGTLSETVDILNF